MKAQPYTHIIIFILAFFAFLSCKEEPETTPDAVGQFSWADWQMQAEWDTYTAPDYTPPSDIIQSLKPKLKNSFKFIIYGSSWCLADCKVQMPRIIKLLLVAGVNENNIIIIGVSRDKQLPESWIAQYFQWFPEQIRLAVPTIVILDNDMPLGCAKAETIDFPAWQNSINNIIP